jgi:hypothetical protein
MAGGKATKKIRKVMLQPKRMAPLRMAPKKVGSGEVRSRYGQGKPLSANRNPDIFRPPMSVDRLPVFEPVSSPLLCTSASLRCRRVATIGQLVSEYTNWIGPPHAGNR